MKPNAEPRPQSSAAALRPDSDLRSPSKTKSHITFVLLIALLAGSVYRTDANLVRLVTGSGEMAKLLKEMLPPDWSYFDVVWQPMLETIRMAIVGTTLGALAAIPLALLAAHNVFASKIVGGIARFALGLLRTMPELLLAGIFVAVFGLGAFAGMLAIFAFSFGLIAKLTYESIEAVDPGPLEAMTAVGANKWQWIRYSIVPQMTAQFAAYFLYALEINIRAASVLGLVGAGGIGLYLNRSLNMFRYDRAALIIICTFAIVLAIDYASTKLRERLL